jgi:hypothetical protein
MQPWIGKSGKELKSFTEEDLLSRMLRRRPMQLLVS